MRQNVKYTQQNCFKCFKKHYLNYYLSETSIKELYINDLPNGLLFNPKLFADDTSVLSVVKDR